MGSQSKQIFSSLKEYFFLHISQVNIITSSNIPLIPVSSLFAPNFEIIL